MKNILPKKNLLLLCLLFTLAYTAQATHIVGGEIVYKYLGAIGPSNAPFRYQVTMSVYVDRNSAFEDGSPEIGQIAAGVYRGDNCQKYTDLIFTPNPQNVSPALPPGCNAGACLGDIQISLNTMTAILDVPFNLVGYYVYWQRCCRNAAVLNIQNVNSAGSTFGAFIPSAIFPNSSPFFLESAIPFILTGDTATFANNAIDPDGDKLIYSFVTPYGGGTSGNPAPFNPTPPQSCPELQELQFATGYTLARPFGTGSFAFIDPATGFTKYYVPNAGSYVVTLEIKEYRTLSTGRDTLLASTRREIQFIAKTAGVGGCPVNAAPVFKSATNTTPTYTYNIQEGQAVSFTIRATDSAADSLYLSAKASILDGSNGYTGPLATFTNRRGIADLSSTFTWQTVCGLRGSFAINATAMDRNCPPKSSSAIYTINVLPFKAPTRIFGSDTVCSTSPIGTYFVQNGGAPDGQFTWKVTGGALIGNVKNDSIRVQWNNNNSNGFLTLVQNSTGGCRDSITTKIYRRGFQTIVARIPSVNAKNITICQGQSVGLSATGSTSGYRWSPSTGLSSATSATPTATPTTTTRYIVSVGTGSTINCWKTDTLNVTVIPRVADAGPASTTVCSSGGDSISIGVAAVSGYTYQWSPTTGIGSPTKSNPKIKIVSANPVKYYVNATHIATGCVSRDSITLNINPAPVAVAGTSDTLTICSGGVGQLGAARVSGVKYLWSPATGLSRDTLPDPTVTLTNTGSTTLVVRYIIQATSKTNSCQAFDTIYVKVKPALAAAPVGLTTTGCINQPVIIGQAPIAGYTYAWSPKAGLDDSTKANPTLIATTNGVKNYTLTVIDATGCKSAATPLSVTISPKPVVVLGNNTSVCSGGSITLGGAAQGGLSYQWKPATGLSNATLANPTLTPTGNVSSPQVVSYQLIVSNGSSCRDSATLNVTIQPKPVANAGGDSVTICSEGSIQIGSAKVNTIKYKWLQNTGLNDDTLSAPTVTLTNNGTVPVKTRYILQVTDRATGCINFDTILVKVLPLPIAVVGTAPSGCINGTAVLGGTPNPNFTYAWSPKAGLDDSTKANPVFTPSASGTTTYNLVVTDNTTGCKSKPTPLQVNINVLPPVVLGTNNVVCSGENITLGGAAQAGFTYQWKPTTGLGNASSANPTLTLTNTTGAPQVVTYQLAVRNNTTQCKDSATINITVNPKPLANAGGDSVTICSEGSIQIGSAKVNTIKYKWLQNTGLNDDTLSAPTVTLTNNGTVPVKNRYILQVTDRATGCINFDTILVKVNPLPTALAGTSQAICVGGLASLGSTPNPNFTYTWSPKTGLDDSTKANPVVSSNVVGAITYTLVVKDNTTGCISKPATASVSASPLPIANAGGDTVTICSEGSIQIGSAKVNTIKYKWLQNTGMNDDTLSAPTVTLTNNGTVPVKTSYILQVTDRVTGCLAFDTIFVKVNPLPTALAGAPQDICVSGTATLGGLANSNFTYAWTPKAGLDDSTKANPVFTPSTAAPRTYTLTVTDNTTGCKSKTATTTINVNPLPVANVGTQNQVCVGGNTIVLGGTADPNLTYTWSPKAGLDDSTKANPVFTSPNVAGTATYTLTVKNNTTNCQSTTATLNITVNPLPVVQLISETATICTGQSVQIGVSNPLANHTYTWTGTGLSNNNAAAPTATLTNTTTSPIQVIFPVRAQNTQTGCFTLDTVTVTVNPKPVALVGSVNVACFGTTAVIGGVANPNLTYAWSPKTNLDDSTKANPVFTAEVVGANNYTLTVTDNATGCKSDVTNFSMTVNPLPTANAGNDKIVCSAQNVSLGVAPIVGQQYIWSSKEGLSDSTIANPVFNLVYSGTDSLVKEYVLTVKNIANGLECSKTDTVRVIVRGLPSVAGLGASAVSTCSGVSAVLGADSIAGYTYEWQPATGLSSNTVAKPTVLINNTGNTPQVINYILTVKDSRKPAPQCSNTMAVVLTVNPLPIVQVGANDSLCSGGSIVLGAAPVAGFTYAWSPKAGLDDSTKANPTLSLVNATQNVVTSTYTLLVTNDVTGCKQSKTIDIRVNPLPIVKLGTADSLCSGGTITIGEPAETGFSYAWSPVDGLSNASAANPTLSLVNQTDVVMTKDYTLTVTNSKTGCVSAAVLPVRINPLPTVLVGTADSLCSGGNIVLGSNPVAGFTYAWSPKIGLDDSTKANPTLSLLNATQAVVSSNYTLTVTNNITGCKDAKTIQIRVNPLPIVNVGTNDSLCSGASIVIGAEPIVGFSYAWSPKIGLDDSTKANPVLSLVNATQVAVTPNYTLTVTNNVTGCKESKTIQIRVNPLPIAEAGAPVQICSGESVAIGTAALPNTQYAWTSNGQGTLTNSTSAIANYTAINTTQTSRIDTLYLKTTAVPSGCQSVDTVLVNVYKRPVPQAILFASTWVCPNSEAIYKIEPAAGTNNTYAWAVAGGSIVGSNTGTQITVAWGGTNNNAKVYVRATNPQGCEGELDSLQININPQLQPVTPAGADTLCSFDVANQLYSTGAFGNPSSLYTFFVQQPNGNVTSLPPQLGNNQISVNWQGLGLGRVWVRENITTSTTVCEGVSDTLDILIQPSPDSTLKIAGQMAYCEQSNDALYVLGGAASGSAFEWTITPTTGATFAGNINNDSVRVNWLQAGTYTLSVREISAAGCVGEIIDTTIIVNPLPATVLNTYDTLICTESLAARVYSVSGLTGSQYVWTLKGGVFANNDTTGSSVTVNWTANALEKSLSVREISAAGCSATAVLNVPLFYDGSAVSLQQVSLLEDNTSTVEIKFAVQNLASYPVNGTVEILRRAQGTTAWTSVVTLPATVTSYQDQPENASSTVYEYQVLGKNRCGADLGSRVHNTVLIKAFALEADRISQLTWNAYNGWPAGAVRYEIYRKLEGGSFEAYDNAAGNAQTWERKNASDAFVQCYKIKAISEEGYFSWSNELCINFENKLVIANVITPNGDGKNDTWRIGNIDLYPDSEIKIFNRWGKKVYESKSYDNTWAGDGLEVGTYFYEVISEQKGVKAKGWIDILR